MSNATTTTKIHPAYHTTSGRPVYCACGAVDASEPCQWDGIGEAALVRKVGERTEYVLSAECAERYAEAGEVAILRDATEADAIRLSEASVEDAALALDRAALHEVAVFVRAEPTKARLLEAAKAATTAANNTRPQGVAEIHPDGTTIRDVEVQGARQDAARLCARVAASL